MTDNLHSTTDAQKWARSFIHQMSREDASGDEATMLVWFVNAIETGRTAGQGPMTRLLIDDEALEEACSFYHHGHAQAPDDWADLEEPQKAWYRASMRNLIRALLNGDLS